MARPFEPCSNHYLNGGGHLLKQMARPGGETSNALIDVLPDWNEQLKHSKFDFDDPDDVLNYDPEEPQP